MRTNIAQGQYSPGRTARRKALINCKEDVGKVKQVTFVEEYMQ